MVLDFWAFILDRKGGGGVLSLFQVRNWGQVDAKAEYLLKPFGVISYPGAWQRL
jgi:hypothetical protein